MRKLLGTLVILVFIVGVIGASRDWFTVKRTTEGSNTDVHVQFNRDKIRSDTRTAAQAARQIGQNLDERISDNSDNSDNSSEEAATD